MGIRSLCAPKIRPTDRYIPRGKQHWEAEPVSIFYARTTGIWQTVWLEPVGRQSHRKLRITPRVDGCVLEAKIAHPEPSQFVTVTISYNGQQLATGMSLRAMDREPLAPSRSDPRLWSPEYPHLYDITAELHRAWRPARQVESYFGFRSVATQDGKVLLNGNPIFLKPCSIRATGRNRT